MTQAGGSRANCGRQSKAYLVPIPTEAKKLADELARLMVAAGLELLSLEEVRLLVAEMEAKLRKLH
jgi:glutathione synthase/RimK-type ligase-like ATP-grasp enzyme